MAEGATSTHVDPGFQALIEEQGTCAVCLEIVRDHRALPCQHVFCLECLEPLVNNNRIRCPTCQEERKLKRGSVKHLPKSIFLVPMLEQMSVECRKKSREVECPHCMKWLCNGCHGSCRESIRTTKENRVSRVTDFDIQHQKFLKKICEKQKYQGSIKDRITQQIKQHTREMMKKLQTAEKKILPELEFEYRELPFEDLLKQANELKEHVQDHSQKLKALPETQTAEVVKLCEELQKFLDSSLLDSPLPMKDVTFIPHEVMFPVGELLVHIAHRLWHIEQGTSITDLCHVTTDGRQAVLYMKRREDISLVTMEGERLSLPIDSSGMEDSWYTASDIEGSRVVVAGSNKIFDLYDCTVYSSERYRLHKLRTFRLNGSPQSLSWTPEGGIIVILRNIFCPSSIERLSDSGEVRWERETTDVDIRRPGHVTVCPVTGNIYVSDRGSGCVRELSPQGEYCRDINTPGMTQPYPLCIDSRGQSLFVCGEQSRDIYLVTLDGTVPRLVIQAPDDVSCLGLYRDRYLSVGSKNGLALYDVASLLSA